MKKKVLKTVICFALVAIFSIGLTGCSLFESGSKNTTWTGFNNGTFYKYVNGTADKDSWIKLETNKWSDSDETSGKLVSKNGKVYCYTDLFGEEELVFFGTVKDGVFSWTVDESEPYTKYYKIGAYKDNSGNSGNSGSNVGNSTGTKGLKYFYYSWEDENGKFIEGYFVWGGFNNTNIVIPPEYNGKPVVGIDVWDWTDTNLTQEVLIQELNARAKVKSITIPDSVKYVSFGHGLGLAGMSDLTSITVDKNNPVLKSEGNCLLTKDGTELIFGCKNSIIPNSVTAIGNGAFEDCTGLTNIVIPSSVEEINPTAFSGCSGLTSIQVVSTNPNYKSENNCILTKDGKTLVVGCKTSTIPNSVTCIGWCAFQFCDSLVSIKIPYGVTEIEAWAFANCGGLKIEIPNSVTFIDYRAFQVCNGMRIDFKGTKAEWQNIKRSDYDWDNWDEEIENYTIYCTDGTISK